MLLSLSLLSMVLPMFFLWFADVDPVIVIVAAVAISGVAVVVLLLLLL